MNNITNGNIKIYPKGANMNATSPAEHIIELTSSEYGAYDTYYGPAVLPDGDYFYVCSAPGKGRVVRDLTINATTPANEFIDKIVLREGLTVVTANLLRYVGPGDEPPLEAGVTLLVNRLKAVGQGDGSYIIENVPVGTNTIKVIPDGGNEDTYQAYESIVDLTASQPNFTRVIYPPFNIRIRVLDGNGHTYTSGTVHRVTESGTKIDQLSLENDQRYVFFRAWDATHRFRVFDANGRPASDILSHNLSYLNDAPTGSTNLTFNIR